jgi:nucleotide-binding universal stress UspA family protein
MKRVVVGVDGSEGAAQALRWATRLAGSQNAELVVMSGYSPVEAELPPGRADELLAAHRDRLEAWSVPARQGDLAVRTVVKEGDARPGVLEVADDEDADLIVVGRVGTSAGPGLLSLGSVAEWLAHRAERPLAVVGGRVHAPVRSLLVGVDGSDGSQAAVQLVADLCHDTDIRVVAAMVAEPILEWTPANSPDNWRRHVEEQVRAECDALTRAGIDFTPIALDGMNTGDALIRAATEERTDLLVAGMRGVGGFTGLRLGGVALRLLHNADRPVLLVPTD